MTQVQSTPLSDDELEQLEDCWFPTMCRPTA
jgi:hypothetical protein